MKKWSDKKRNRRIYKFSQTRVITLLKRNVRIKLNKKKKADKIDRKKL